MIDLAISDISVSLSFFGLGNGSPNATDVVLVVLVVVVIIRFFTP